MTDPRGTGPCSSGYTTTTGYDTRNRKWHVWDAQSHETTFTYDNASNVTRIDHPDSSWEQKTYDEVNRVLTDSVLKSSTPSQVILTTWFTYNPSGTLSAVTDARGSGPGDVNYTTSFQYNASDQRTSMTYPRVSNHSDTQTWFYDNAHNLEYRTTANSQQQEMQIFYYDNRNRRYANWWNNWQNNIVDWRYFGYDAASRLTEAENGTGGWNANIISGVQRIYDAAGRLTTDQQTLTGLPGGGRSVNYFYDDDGKINRMYATGTTYDYTFSYDAMGRFEKIFITNSSQLFQYYHDAASNETKRHNCSDNVDQIYTPDALNRISVRDLQNSGQSFSTETYTYDPMSRIRIVLREDGKQDNFAYYLDGELSVAQYGLVNNQNPTRSVNYTLDNAGNRTVVTDTSPPGNTSYRLNNINQYTAVNGGTVWLGTQHETTAFGSVQYQYLNDEQLESAHYTVNGDNYQLAYDALGRCVTRTVTINNSATTTFYVYDGEKPVTEFDSTGAIVAKNLYGKGIDEILMRVDVPHNCTLYYQQDHEGSVTHITNAGGGVIEKYKYDVFGLPTLYDGNNNQRTTSAYNNRFMFTGREYAATYGIGFQFYEYRARAYNPILGRFMSEDPKGFDAGDYNLFRYCHNDPEDLTDPMGLEQDWAQTGAPVSGNHVSTEMVQEDRAYNFIMGLMQRQFNSAISAGMVGYQQWSAWSASQAMGGLTMGNVGQIPGQGGVPSRYVPALDKSGHQKVEDQGYYKDYQWQLVDSKDHPVQSWGSKEPRDSGQRNGRS